jgi:hypothetical protein
MLATTPRIQLTLFLLLLMNSNGPQPLNITTFTFYLPQVANKMVSYAGVSPFRTQWKGMISTPLGKKKCGWAEHQLLAAWLRDEGARRCGGRTTPNIPSSSILQEVGGLSCIPSSIILQEVCGHMCAGKLRDSIDGCCGAW